MAAALKALPKEGFPEGSTASWLVLYDQERSTAYLEGLLAVAHACGAWERILVASEWLPLRSADEWPVPFSRYRQGLGQLLGAVQVCELWLQHLHSFAERLLVELYPEAPVVLCEDGLGAYIAPVMWRQTAGDALRALIRHPALLWPGRMRRQLASARVSNWRWEAGHVRRIRRRYLLLADVFGHVAPFSCRTDVLIPGSAMRKVLKAAGERLLQDLNMPEPRKAIQTDAILMVSENSSLFVDRIQAIRLYRTLITRLVDKGYSVLWKDHPRERESLFQQITEGMPTELVRPWPYPMVWPVELFALDLNIRGCAGGWSSSPWYLERYAGIPAYGYGKELVEACELSYPPVFGQFAMQRMRDLAEIPQRAPARA